MTDDSIRPAEIADAMATIRPYVRHTPTVEIEARDLGLNGAPFTLKLELMQHSGSFKTRGAFLNLLTRDVPSAGVVAASGGNHGAAVAYAAGRLGIPARVFVPTVASGAKTSRIEAYGAQLVVGGDRYDDALEASARWATDTGALPVHAYDQRETLVGQGTTAFELLEQVPELDTVLVAVGGGGLIGGMAAYFRGEPKLVGVEPEGSPTLHRALEAGRPVDSPAEGIAADSLAPRRVGELMFPLAQRFIERVVLVSDDDIRNAQRVLWSVARVVAEPGGAAALAAVVSGAYRAEEDERVGILVCGGNTDVVDFGS